jgi:uroporphyrinogen III methyltransferase/synthase
MSQSQPQLSGKTIAITRPAAQADAVMERLRALGAIPISTPTIAIVPPEDFSRLDAAVRNLSSYDWLLVTSVNGVRVVLERLDALGVDRSTLGSIKIGAIGPATARALQAGGGSAAFVPTTYTAEGILAEIGPVSGQRLLLPRAELARPTLAAGLRRLGGQVDEITAYRTVPGPGINELTSLLRAGRLDAVTFTSSSTVRFLYEGLLETSGTGSDMPAMLAHAAVICIGPVTAAAATALGLRVDVVADSYTIDGLVAAIAAFFSRPESNGGLTQCH